MTGIETPNLLIIEKFLDRQWVIFQTLLSTVKWDESMKARKTASFGVPYNYLQMSYAMAPMHPILIPIQSKLLSKLGVKFNNCLLNYYETGDNKMGFHSDDTSALQAGTGVAIVSLGNPRKITFRNKKNKDIRHNFLLSPGSLLYMENSVQNEWVHAINKQKGVESRISLTWRAFDVNEFD